MTPALSPIGHKTGPRANEVLKTAGARLRAAGVSDAVGDARRLLAFAWGLSSSRLTLQLVDRLPDEVLNRFDKAIAARIKRQPVSQITGERQFWGRSFRVTPDVLDPRPETETLVVTALSGHFARILDLGTGSGALAVTLLAERRSALGVAVDISAPAVAVAQENATRHGVQDRLDVLEGDWCTGLSGHFDLIVSNPPYISAAEMPDLAPEVRDWEPALALTDGGDGLGAYRQIAKQAPGMLAPGGRLMVEVGVGQGEAVAEMFKDAGLIQVCHRRDLDGRVRVVVASAAKSPT